MSATGGPNIISRAEWNARSPRQAADKMKNPAEYVFIHHSAGAFACDRASCTTQVKSFQDLHMDTNKWDDVGYSFVVGEDGNVYEGRGWTGVGAHTRGYNAKAIGICIIGNYNIREPNSAALNTVHQLIEYGVKQGHISPTYILKGHRDVGATECPGQKLYELVRTWDHYQ